MAKEHLSEGQALPQPRASAEDSSFCSNDGCLHLAFEEEGSRFLRPCYPPKALSTKEATIQTISDRYIY